MCEAKYTAFIDILGISCLTEDRYDIAKDKIQLLQDLFYSITKDNRGKIVQSIAFSDSIILIFNTLEEALEVCIDLYIKSFGLNYNYLQCGNDAKYKYILLRGAISSGEISIDNKRNIENEIFIVGNSLVRSVKYESLLKGSRLLVVDNDIDIKDIGLISSKNDYSIHELYWPNYFTKGEPIRNIKLLLEMCNNYKDSSESVLLHYTETLLLFIKSYFIKFFKEDKELLKDIISEVLSYCSENETRCMQTVIKFIINQVIIDEELKTFVMQNHIIDLFHYVIGQA